MCIRDRFFCIDRERERRSTTGCTSKLVCRYILVFACIRAAWLFLIGNFLLLRNLHTFSYSDFFSCWLFRSRCLGSRFFSSRGCNFCYCFFGSSLFRSRSFFYSSLS